MNAPVRIGETLVLHGSDLLRWRDGSSGADPDDPATMALLDRPVTVTFDDPPADLYWLNRAGRTALWRRPTLDIVEGLATDAERARAAAPEYPLSGRVADAQDGYLPRRFALDVGAGTGHDLLLYPSPQGTRFGTGGGLTGSLRFDLTAPPLPDLPPDSPLADLRRPVPWAIVEVLVTVGAGDLRRFRAQTNGNGDFRLSLWRLPPLPEGTNAWPAVLSVRAVVLALGDDPIDPDDPVAMQIAVVPPPPPGPPVPIVAGAFAATLALDLVPGDVRRIPDTGPRQLALRPP